MVWTRGRYETSETIEVNSSGVYEVTASNDCGTESASANVSILNSPSVTPFPFDTIICAGDVILLDPNWSADGPITWTLTYTDTTGIVNTEILSSTEEVYEFNQIDIPADAQSSQATLSTFYQNACGQAFTEILIGSDACFITAPNIITPDNDGDQSGTYLGGLNEGWKIIGIDGVSGVEVQIYDRWGGLVYKNDSYSNLDPWRGEHSNGSLLDDGVYFYIINTPKGEKEITGSVTLLRDK